MGFLSRQAMHSILAARQLLGIVTDGVARTLGIPQSSNELVAIQAPSGRRFLTARGQRRNGARETKRRAFHDSSMSSGHAVD